MNIERDIEKDLRLWNERSDRKPLILQGARQVGKTWILKHFGKKYFENIAYFNFDKTKELRQFFENSKEPTRIIQNLSLVNGSAITPGKTLIIFDEIQECNEALNSLKYFCEEAPEYAIACAGSLLGVALSRGASFPVGKTDFLKMFPLTFREFLTAADKPLQQYADGLFDTNREIEPIPDIFFNKFLEKFKTFFISGGMPEPVVKMLSTYDTNEVQYSLNNLLEAYTLDFSKHIQNNDIPKLNQIWNSLPSQLAKENKKFLYQAVKPGARAREYENSLEWLIKSGLVYKIFCNTKPALPLDAYDDITSFKIYLPDVGLLRNMSKLDPRILIEGSRLFTEFKGSLTENYILTSLVKQFNQVPKYWKSNNKAEVDFIIQYNNQIIPIEVKSDENIRSKSMAVYKKEYNPKICIRYSLRNLKYDGNTINIPLFFADYTTIILDYCHIK